MTDTTALRRHRRRADHADLFLQNLAADEVEDRLGVVNRPFKAPAIVTPFAEPWCNRLPGALICPDADTLDLQPGAHDLVIHSLGLHWANDPVGQLIQCRRALKPDGLMIAATLGGRTLEELRAAIGSAEIATSGGLSPRIAPMGEIRDLGALLQRAGFALPVADSAVFPATYRDAWHLMHDLRANAETSALAQRHRKIPPRALFEEAARHYAHAFGTTDGRVRATFELVFLTGWAPDDSQQKPLRPGSAKARLADALAVREKPLPD